MASPTAMTTRLSSLRIHSKNPLQAAMTERSQHARRPHLTPESPRPGASKTVVDSEERRRLWSIGLWNSACSNDLEAEGGEQDGGSPRVESRKDWELETRRVLGEMEVASNVAHGFIFTVAYGFIFTAVLRGRV
jgi:hypothetical protein